MDGLGLVMQPLWWNANKEKWELIDHDAFARWRGFGELLDLPSGDRIMPNIPEGDHRFVMCILDEDGEEIVNFIAHRYYAGHGGTFEGCPTELTEQESREWDKFYSQATMTEEEELRLRELQNKEFITLQLAPNQLECLVRDVPWKVPNEIEHGFWRAYKIHGGNISDGSSTHH